MRSLVPYLPLLPTLIMLFFGWLCLRNAKVVIAAEGPDARMLVPIQKRGIGRLVDDVMDRGPAVMSARGVRRLGWAFVLLSPLPIGFMAGWHVFSPAHWMRQFDSPCAEIVPESLVAKYAKGDIDVDVKDMGDHCSARFDVEGDRVLSVRIRQTFESNPFRLQRRVGGEAGDELYELDGFPDKSLVRRRDRQTTIMALRRGYLLEVEASGRLHGDRPEAAISKAIRKGKRRIQLDRR